MQTPSSTGQPEVHVPRLHTLPPPRYLIHTLSYPLTPISSPSHLHILTLSHPHTLTPIQLDIEVLHEREDWQVHAEEEGIITSLPILFENRVVEVLLTLKEIVLETNSRETEVGQPCSLAAYPQMRCNEVMYTKYHTVVGSLVCMGLPYTPLLKFVHCAVVASASQFHGVVSALLPRRGLTNHCSKPQSIISVACWM